MQALFDLAHNSHGQPVPLHLIAQRQDLSLPFLEQIFNKLKRAGIVASVRGPRGGYILTRPCNQVTVGDVLRLTDANLRFYSEQMQRLRKRGYRFIPLKRLPDPAVAE